MPDATSRGPRRPRGTLRRGFGVLGVAIRREPAMFTVSTIGAMLFGGLTVADAWVLGWSTDHVVLPAFESGVTPGGALVTSVALFVAVAIVRGASIHVANGVDARPLERLLDGCHGAIVPRANRANLHVAHGSVGRRR